MESQSPSWIMYASIVALISCSAFFSTSETVVSTFNRLRVKKQAQDGNSSAQKVIDLSENYEKTISTILIGNTIVNISVSTIATILATSLFGASGPLISTVAITFLLLIFGEILPKNYGKINADALAITVAKPLNFICIIFTPLSFFFSKISNMFFSRSNNSPSVTEEELIYYLDTIEEEGILEEQERDLVQSALEFDKITIREIITPRVNLVALDIDDSIEEITEIVLAEGYSRIPVYEKTVDNIIGILYSRDFLRSLVRDEEIDIRSMLKTPYFVHKGIKLSFLLSNLKSRKVNLAVVIDEYGGTLGIVTMEDLLEELVGDIYDEDEDIPKGVVNISDTKFEIDASYDINEFFEELGFDEYVETEHTTISGWVMHNLEHIPVPQESFEYLNLRCTVLEMEGHRIKKLGFERI